VFTSIWAWDGIPAWISRKFDAYGSISWFSGLQQVGSLATEDADSNENEEPYIERGQGVVCLCWVGGRKSEVVVALEGRKMRRVACLDGS
jgi:hypothetical protein